MCVHVPVFKLSKQTEDIAFPTNPIAMNYNLLKAIKENILNMDVTCANRFK